MALIKNFLLKSPAKINFHLRVLKKVPNRYHLIESLVSLIGLYDEITIKETSVEKTRVSFVGKFSKTISPHDNSIVTVISSLENISEKIKNKNFTIKVKKNIPAGSGLGGGSSNAVTVLLFLIKKFNLKIEKKILLEILNKIGFDSRIFLDKYPKFISHYGERINIFKYKFRLSVLLIYPNKPNFTKTIYQQNKSFSKTFSIKKTQQIIKKNIHEYFHTANNDLVHAAKKINPRIGHLIEYLKKQKMCDFVQMTGSGSCCFAIFKSKKNLLKCEKLVKTRYRSYWTAKTKTIT